MRIGRGGVAAASVLVRQPESRVAALVRRRADVDRWLERIDDINLEPETDMIAKIWPDGVQPVTSPPEINFEGRKAKLSCSTSGASIGYKVMRNSRQQDHWKIYTAPFRIRKRDRIDAVSFRIGYRQSHQSKTVRSVGA